MIPNPDDCCFYEIEEGTRNERVAVGSDGNILRWARSGKADQQWLIVPIGPAKCKILTRQNGENMAVGSNGNILRWSAENSSAQEFEFVNPNKGWWSIKEGTRGEFVAVGSNGNVLRWSKTGGTDQKFRLIPVSPQAKPKPAQGQFQPGEIEDVPRLTAFGHLPPEHSPYSLIGEAVIPAVYVGDPQYSDRIAQVENNPYYLLRREQFWDRSPGRGFYREHDGSTSITERVTIKIGVSETTATSIHKTLGIEVSASGGFNFRGAAINMGTKISAELKVSQSSESKRMEERTHEEKVEFPQGRRFVQSLWTMVDRYTLKRMDHSVLSVWEIALDNTTVRDGYPELSDRD